ncbi:MAG: hypothetical protein SAK29_32280 [Scytonema sp. PMC 1069.18]|nr:hypothetical protein [Scytonema sp. PMC 1069.18]MEC4885468.1 hypothetical protein [Scytonema sp. PMC 1070.18]
MVYLGYAALFVLLLTGMLGSMYQMSAALDEADIPSFSIWTSIACVIAGIPTMLW